ncbi:MAG TPA: HAD-IIIC family phosphatase [Polyangiales bacterium]|nr:HAD-IIIC family phosphatase [Polyangiales bacterium]
MKLQEALTTVANARAHAVDKRVALACGIEPLHLRTYLEAHYATRLAGHRLELECGLYGDLEGNIDRAATSACDAVAIVFEWGDLDPRLGLRSVGAWSGPIYDEIIADVNARLARMAQAVERITAHKLVALSPPTIPWMIAGSTIAAQHSAFELALAHALASFLVRVSHSPRALVVHPAQLERLSPPSQRHDPRMELAVGFPYRLPHASALAELIVTLLFPPAPKKALITDLDDTLWKGLVGEIGADKVTWTHADGSQLHGMYQLVLRQLADMGVLLGVASKNDPDVVRMALAREELWIEGSRFFPVHASWSPKSQSVTAILEFWNISAEDVVFIDDSQIELDEVSRIHPGLECVLFTPSDPVQALRSFEKLRTLFGRPRISHDDTQRSASLRAIAAFEVDRGAGSNHAAFIQSLDGVVSFRRDERVDQERVLQLLNKTNQFNLNGRRVADQELARLVEQPDGFVVEVAYRDRYGSLGTIGVVAGRLEADRLSVLHWVLSCRAFSRNLEHHMLQRLIQVAGERPLHLAYEHTARNGPLQQFLAALAVPLDSPLILAPARAAELLLDQLPHALRAADG